MTEVPDGKRRYLAEWYESCAEKERTKKVYDVYFCKDSQVLIIFNPEDVENDKFEFTIEEILKGANEDEEDSDRSNGA